MKNKIRLLSIVGVFFITTVVFATPLSIQAFVQNFTTNHFTISLNLADGSSESVFVPGPGIFPDVVPCNVISATLAGQTVPDGSNKDVQIGFFTRVNVAVADNIIVVTDQQFGTNSPIGF